jgi:hypothetical protein
MKCKNSDKENLAYTLMFYVFAKSFHKKPILVMLCEKKIKFGAKNKLSAR